MTQLSKHYLGLPCQLGEVVGRIVGESEKGSWGEINGEKVHSMPLFSTPHGTVVETGRFHLSEITNEGMTRLLQYETELTETNEKLYGGRLNEVTY